tara:strand:- start:1095 stop:1319 length:225 start_codon:yes stop_codon:yes gene_type:complete
MATSKLTDKKLVISFMSFLLAAGMSYYMSTICYEAPNLTELQIKERAEEMFPYRMGQNNHNKIYYYGLSCKNKN